MKRLVVALAIVTGIAAPASAGIIATTGDFQVFASATASYIADPYDDPIPAPIHIWVEQQAISLAAAVVLDTDLANSALQYVIAAAGAGQVVFGAGSGPTLAAGTQVNVYYAYFDPLNDSALGSVTFAEPVLGIVAHTIRLPFSDFLRVPGAPYNAADPDFVARGWEDPEWGQLSADRRTFTFSGIATTPADQFRIFTAASVPEPEMWLLLALSTVAIAFRYRRTARPEVAAPTAFHSPFRQHKGSTSSPLL